MTRILLENRTILKIGGEEATHFLNNLVTCDVETMEPGQAKFGALLSPQGKILFDFFIFKTPESYLLDVVKDLAGELQKRLMFYRLRAKVTLEARPELSVISAIGEAFPSDSGEQHVFVDPRHKEMGQRAITDNVAADILPQQDAYMRARITVGIGEGSVGDKAGDFTYGDAFPHETLMDQFGGVDFKKGCYIGQEVVSRMQHRSTARKRIIKVTAQSDLPETGSEIVAEGKVIGVLGSRLGKHGLGLVRLDRAKKAIDGSFQIMAGSVEIELQLPDWVNFSWPQ